MNDNPYFQQQNYLTQQAAYGNSIATTDAITIGLQQALGTGFTTTTLAQPSPWLGYAGALRGLLTGIVMMMKRADIRTFVIEASELKSMVEKVVVVVGGVGNIEVYFEASLASLSERVLDEESIGLEDDEEVRVTRDEHRLTIRIIAPGDNAVREMAKVVDELQEQAPA